MGKTDRNGIQTDAAGYVLGVRCAKGHSGNRRLTHSQGRWYECCGGCGEFVGVDTIADFQRSAKLGKNIGENMAGGLYTRPTDYAAPQA